MSLLPISSRHAATCQHGAVQAASCRQSALQHAHRCATTDQAMTTLVFYLMFTTTNPLAPAKFARQRLVLKHTRQVGRQHTGSNYFLSQAASCCTAHSLHSHLTQAPACNAGCPKGSCRAAGGRLHLLQLPLHMTSNACDLIPPAGVTSHLTSYSESCPPFSPTLTPPPPPSPITQRT